MASVKMRSAIIILLLPLLCRAQTSVTINGTTIIGRLFESAEQEAFRGIPYAEPPIGGLRLRPPRPKGTLSFTLDARDFGPACIQPYATTDVSLSEDCLTLNIQRPLGTTNSSALPVMVWVHGGGFLFGRSSSPEFNAINLVSHSVSRGTPIIYVNLNYRLGPLGFPQGTEAAEQGHLNLGLMDQMVAFQWVQDNIASFGGDPNKVTLFGESAGATSIATHLLNANLVNLASGVILHSGALATASGEPNLRNNDWRRFVEAAGCAQDFDNWACLRTSTSENLLKAVQVVSSWDEPLSFSLAIDGPGGVFPDRPSYLLGNSSFVKIPIITGVNLDEGTMLTPVAVNSTQYIKEYLFKHFSGSVRDTKALAGVVDQLLELYPDIPSLGSPYNTGNETFGLSSQFKRMSAMLGDIVIVAPVRQHNKALARAGVSTYTYLFTQKQQSTLPHWGVAHSANIPFVYGQPQEPVSESSKRLSVQMMDYWLSFAYTRTPNDGIGSTREEWKSYTPDSEVALQLDGDNMGIVSDDYRSKQIDFILSKLAELGL